MNLNSESAHKNKQTRIPFWKKATKTPFSNTQLPVISYSESFQKRCLAQTMNPIALYKHAKIGQIIWAVLEKKPKTSKIGHFIPFNPGLIFFHKSNLARTLCPIFIYNHAKNWEVPWSRFREKAKNLKKRTLPIIQDIFYQKRIVARMIRPSRLQSCKILGKSLRAVLKKRPKTSTTTKNKTKYTMDPGIYYLLEADEENTNRY